MKQILITSIFLFTLVGRFVLNLAPVAATGLDRVPLLRQATSAKQPQTATSNAQLDEPFTLGLAQWASIGTLENFSVQFAGVPEDSRCPAHVDCIRAGEALITLNLRSDRGEIPPITLSTIPSKARSQLDFADYTIELLEVQPYPQNAAASTEIKADEYRITLVVRRGAAPTPMPIGSDEEELAAALDQPFALHVGQTAHLEDVDFRLTLRSISDDSGCLTVDDCSIMTADGSLVLRRGDETQLFSFTASFDPETPFRTEFAGLEIHMSSIQQLTNGGHVATFVVTQPSTAVDNGDLAPAVSERCPYFSRFDAAAILQEDMQPNAVANLRFYPQPDLVDELQGLCGYVGAENIPYPATEIPMIHLLTAVESERAVVAARLGGAEIRELLPFALNALQENPQSRDSDFARLVTQLTAGSYDEVIPFFRENAEQSDSIQSEPISGIGDDGVWLWQPIPGGAFSLLLIRAGDEFDVVAALLGEEVDELTVLDYSVIIARRMVESQSAQPGADEPSANDEPANNAPTLSCDLLVADAEAILGEAVHAQVVETDTMGCGYIAASDISPAAEDFSVSAAHRGVFLQHLAGEELTSTLEGMAETVSEGIDRPNEAAQTLFKAAIRTGNVKQAIRLLPNLAHGSTDWQVERVSGVGEAAAFFWGRADDRRVAALVKLSEAGDAVMMVASLGDEAHRAAVRAALVAAKTLE